MTPRLLFLEMLLFARLRMILVLLPAVGLLAPVWSCSAPEPPASRRQLRDDLGRSIDAPRSVSRIVTLAPNVTEIVYAMHGEAHLAGTDSFSDEPAAAKKLPHVGGLNPSVERIASLRPDLVLATTNGNPPSLEPALASAGIPLFVLRTDRLDEIPRAIITVGDLLAIPSAPQIAQRLSESVAAQRRIRKRPPRVLFVVWADPLYVGGAGTFADDLIVLTGGVNSVPAKGWPQLSLETLAASAPDLVLYPDRSVPQSQMKALVERIPALQRARIVAVDENLFTRPGPRVATAAVKLNEILDAWERR